MLLPIGTPQLSAQLSPTLHLPNLSSRAPPPCRLFIGADPCLSLILRGFIFFLSFLHYESLTSPKAYSSSSLPLCCCPAPACRVLSTVPVTTHAALKASLGLLPHMYLIASFFYVFVWLRCPSLLLHWGWRELPCGELFSP